MKESDKVSSQNELHLETELELHEPETELQDLEEETKLESKQKPQDELQPNEQEIAHQQPHVDPIVPSQYSMGSHRSFRPQKFQPRNWNGIPRWPQGQFQGQRPPMRGPPMQMMGGPAPPPVPQMRPGGPFPPQRPPFFGPGGARPPQQRFFNFQNQPGRPQAPNYVPSPIQPGPAPMGSAAMPRKVLINPNFKGGIEAVKCK